MREWPSIVPGAPEDYHIVVNRYGRFGAAFVETDLDRADFENTIADTRAGLAPNPQNVALVKPQVPGRDTSVSLLVMNSSSTGTPSFVFWMPRWMAGTMSSGFVTRSP